MPGELLFLDCDWFDEPVLVGKVFCEFLRGEPKYTFEFDRGWLTTHPNIVLSADLELFAGRQYSPSGTEIFACLSDAMPNRWGRLLLKRWEQIQASRNHEKPRMLNAFDFLCGVDDLSRMGAFRFKTQPDGDFLHATDALSVPPISSIRELMHYAQQIEESELGHRLPEEKWVRQLLQPASSLGGARPKATVRDEHNELWIAKFASRNDKTDVGAWEYFAYQMAQRAGIQTAATRLLSVAGAHHVFLVKRFDRQQNKRIHFASSMTLLGLKDGDGAVTGHGYPDIAATILENCIEVEKNLEELYRRAAFNICIGNTDDHFRNHGFVLTQKGWTLSPAYDMNPTASQHQSLLINNVSDASDIELLRQSANEYMISDARAQTIIEEVLKAMQDWENVAKQLRLSGRDIELFRHRFVKS